MLVGMPWNAEILGEEENCSCTKNPNKHDKLLRGETEDAHSHMYINKYGSPVARMEELCSKIELGMYWDGDDTTAHYSAISKLYEEKGHKTQLWLAGIIPHIGYTYGQAQTQNIYFI